MRLHLRTRLAALTKAEPGALAAASAKQCLVMMTCGELGCCICHAQLCIMQLNHMNSLELTMRPSAAFTPGISITAAERWRAASTCAQAGLHDGLWHLSLPWPWQLSRTRPCQIRPGTCACVVHFCASLDRLPARPSAAPPPAHAPQTPWAVTCMLTSQTATGVPCGCWLSWP